MRNVLLISLAALSLANASPTQPQNRVIAQFFGYFDALRAIQFENMLLVAINFVEQIVEGVPAEERGPASATLQAYVNRGKELRQRGSDQEKFEHVKSLQDVFDSLHNQPFSTESDVIEELDHKLRLRVRDEVRKDNEKLYKRFVEGATQMKAKLTPTTVARESELFGVIDELIHFRFYVNDPLIERFLNFKNRY